MKWEEYRVDGWTRGNSCHKLNKLQENFRNKRIIFHLKNKLNSLLHQSWASKKFTDANRSVIVFTF